MSFLSILPMPVVFAVFAVFRRSFVEGIAPHRHPLRRPSATRS